jgi:hypothetical protein
MKFDCISDVMETLDGVAGLLQFVSCLCDTPDALIPTAKYKAPAFALLSDLTQSAGDFLSNNEAAITQALEAEEKEKPAGKTCEAPDGHNTTTHNG